MVVRHGIGMHWGWRAGLCILGFCAGAGVTLGTDVTLGTGALGSLVSHCPLGDLEKSHVASLSCLKDLL